MPDSIAVFIPIISPRVSSKGPPESPGSTRVSVQIALGIEKPTEMGSLREDNSCR
jgi:hypothetical protein